MWLKKQVNNLGDQTAEIKQKCLYSEVFGQNEPMKVKFQTATGYLGLTKKGMYYDINQKCNNSAGDECTFKGWFLDKEGIDKAKYTHETKDPNCRIDSGKASTERCQTITYYAVYDIKFNCTNSLHDTTNKCHRTSVVFIDEVDGKEYGRTSFGENSSMKISLVQNFTSAENTHNEGIYYYRFDGWYDEEHNKIAGDFKEYEHDGLTGIGFVFDEPIVIEASKTECKEVRYYAKWTKHKAPILKFEVKDNVTPFGSSFENTDAKISSFTHTFGNPVTANPEASTGYKFLDLLNS